MRSSVLVISFSLVALAACKPAEPAKTDVVASPKAGATLTATATDAEKIASAASAMPASLAAGAGVMDMAADGSMKMLREASNGFTCMPDNPATPGPDPMCADANGMAWLHAMMSGATPPKGKVGIAYMLQGGVDASNDDPKATTPPAGSDWVRTGPHLMVLGATGQLADFPRDAKDTSRPYIMFPGTPYEHIMVPVGQGG
jgi:hypothetical protein